MEKFYEFTDYDIDSTTEKTKITINDVKVSSIYPLFLKIKNDMANGVYIDSSFNGKEKQDNEKQDLFLKRINISLIEFTKDVYKNAKNNNVIFRNNTCIEILPYNKFYLIFVRANNRLIFLNYIDRKPIDEINVNDCIPKGTKNVFNLNVANIRYRVVNTYDSFIKFCKIKEIDLLYDSNDDFTHCFDLTIPDEQLRNNSFNISREKVDGVVGLSAELINTGYEFEYFVIEDLIIISDYRKHDDLAEVAEILDRLNGIS